MPQAVTILFGAAFTVAVSLALGTLLLRALRLRFYRQEERVLAFVTGSACLSLLVFALATIHLARKGVFLLVGALIIAAAIRRGAHRPEGDSLPPLGPFWRLVFGAVFALFGVYYFFNAMAPEASPDGAAYHLGLVLRYLRAHGFYRITTNIYAYLSQGGELLYLHAFAFGRHSAAALVHFAFLIALPLLMLYYGRRFRFPVAGAAGALFVFLSPVVAYDGTTAYIDVMAACVVFAVFYLLQVWDQERAPGLLVPIGLLAGFAYAVKYTAFLAVPYALGFVAWKLIRKRERFLKPMGVVAVCALIMIGPWAIKNWIWVSNPFSPFLNKVFRNPYVHVQFEQEYRRQLANWGELKTKWDIPLEATVRGGKLQGILGPLFLLAPVALLALRNRARRQLLLATGIFLLTYPANIGTRFLITPLPFLSLALGLAVANWKRVAVVLVLFHGLSSWPKYLETYCDPYAMRILTLPVRAALRIKPEESYLQSNLFGYNTARMVERLVPPDAKLFVFGPPAEAYTTRNILVGYQGALNQNLGDTLWMPLAAFWQPVRRTVYQFQPRAARRIRLVQTAGGSPDNWSVNELRVFEGLREIRRDPRWRLRAWPNPWEVQWAFDNSPMTRWRSWEPVFPGMRLEVDFGRVENVSRVTLLHTPDQAGVKLRLETQAGHEPWTVVPDEPQRFEVQPPAKMRRLAVEELKWHGIEYLMMWDNDFVGPDMWANQEQWGLRLLGAVGDAKLYKIE